jgi:hypothetical protein
MEETKMRSALVALAAGTITLTAGASVVYEDEPTFLDNIQPGYYLEDFNGYVYGGYTEYTLYLENNGWAYTISAEGLVNSFLWSGDGNMSTNNAQDWLRVDFDPDAEKGLPTAVGGWFFASDISGYFVGNRPVVIDLSDGTHYEFVPGSDTDFRGFTTDEAISWMTIDCPDDASYYWSTMDHFYVGAVVPAPGVLALFGLAGLARSRRR